MDLRLHHAVTIFIKIFKYHILACKERLASPYITLCLTTDTMIAVMASKTPSEVDMNTVALSAVNVDPPY